MKRSFQKPVGRERGVGTRSMAEVAPILGRLAWLLVATMLYAVIWIRLDSSLSYAVPEAFGNWLCDFLAITSPEGRHGIFLWTTSSLMVAVLHVVGVAVASRLRDACLPRNGTLLMWLRRSFAAVGWISWLLVSTGVVVLIGEAIYTARGGQLLPHSAKQDVELFLVFLVMCLLHLAVWRLWHRQQR